MTKSIKFEIFIAGNYEQAMQVCREYCFAVGLCVTVEPTTYVYTGGEETGVRIGLINYPRFPSTEEKLFDRAAELAQLLLIRLCQHSYTIMGPSETVWFTRRD